MSVTTSSMLLFKSVWGTDSAETPTFKMIPTSLDCPFNEALYNPSLGVLAVVSKEKKQAYRLVPKINEKGAPVIIGSGPTATMAQERKLMESFYEYYIDDPQDIADFITMFAVNAAKFKWKDYLKKEEKKVSELILP
jgi:hypothetical protein